MRLCRLPWTPLAGLAALLLTSVAHAAEADFRTVTLVDGRELVVQVLETTSTGLDVFLPQGEMTIGFDMLQDMAPADEAAWRSQRPWAVYLVASQDRRQGLYAAFKAVPRTLVVGDRGTEGFVTPAQRAAATECGEELPCVVEALEGAPQWVWVVQADTEGSDLVLTGQVNRSELRVGQRAPLIDVVKVQDAIYSLLGIDAINTASPDEPRVGGRSPSRPPKTPGVARTFGRNQILGMSFVPVPGFPSVRQDDLGSFGLAWGLVVPATAAWVAAAGRNSTSLPQHVLLGLGGFYVTTVAVNQALGLRSLRSGTTVGIVPTGDGGVMVGIGREL